ncbi:hypothetical protein ABW19_dt0204162 [Dactylella cylindrospora]|nr:hypothetical protein ABW19_dt0204162 [Dactylella cylindrospora]
MLATVVHFVELTCRSTILFFLWPFLYVAHAILTLLSRRSKTAYSIIVKAQLIRDVILQSSPPSYQSATKSDQSLLRLRSLEVSLQRRESELLIKCAALDKRQHDLEAERNALHQREIDLSEKEKSVNNRYHLHQDAEAELATKLEKLGQDIASFRREQAEVQKLRDIVNLDRANVEHQRAENAHNLSQLQEERDKYDERVAADQKKLADRQAEIDNLHDRFLRSQVETMEQHRSEHNALIDSLKSRLAESQHILKTEQQRFQEQNLRSEQLQTELEQRCSFLTHELADRTEREYNLGSELGELRQKLSEERAAFNREFGELSKALSDLKQRCSKYEEEIAADEQNQDELKAKTEAIADLEKSISARELLLQARSERLDESEESVKRRDLELSEREEALNTREVSLDEKSQSLLSLQNTLEERSSQVAEAESDLAIRTRGHEDAIKYLGLDSQQGEVHEIADELPDHAVPDSATATSSTPTSPSAQRPTLRERVSRRTNEFVERVNSVAHRRSTSYNSHKHTHSHDSPTRVTESRDGVKSDTK